MQFLYCSSVLAYHLPVSTWGFKFILFKDLQETAGDKKILVLITGCVLKETSSLTTAIVNVTV